MMIMFDEKEEKSNHVQVTGELGRASLASSRRHSNILLPILAKTVKPFFIQKLPQPGGGLSEVG